MPGSHRKDARRARWLRVAVPVLLTALGLVWIRAAHVPAADPTDEAEWTAISIAHVLQLAGQEPPGTDRQRTAGTLDENRWKHGVQGTTFGHPNPCLPKLVWGAVAVARGHENMPARVFQKFHGGDPVQRARAQARTLPARGALRAVVAVLVAGSGALLYLAAAAVGGPGAGLVAWALWLSAPLVGSWSRFVRPDFFMMLFALLALVLALALAPALAERRSRAPLAAALLGLAVGLCAASKLNGALAAFFVAAAVPWIVWTGPPAPSRLLRAIALLALAGLVAASVFWLANPVLWSDPRELGDILAFWQKHMAYQQDRAEGLSVAVARTADERLRLAFGTALGRDEPLRALLGIPGGAALLLGGVAVLGARAFRPAVPRTDRTRAGLVLIWVVVFAIGTALWLPLDWDRYFFPLLAAMVLVEAALVGALVRAVWARVRPGSDEPGSHEPGSYEPGSHDPGSHDPGPAHSPPA